MHERDEDREDAGAQEERAAVDVLEEVTQKHSEHAKDRGSNRRDWNASKSEL